MRKGVGASSRILLERKNNPKPSPCALQPGQETTREWATTHTDCIDLYNAWASQREPYSQRVKRWRDERA
jgi:hypothetical protein